MIETGKVKRFLDDVDCCINITLLLIVEVAYIVALIAAVCYCALLIFVSFAFPLANAPLSAHDTLKASYLFCASYGAYRATLSGFFNLPSIIAGKNVMSIIRTLVSIGIFICLTLLGKYCFNNSINLGLLIIQIILAIIGTINLPDYNNFVSPSKPDNLNDVLQYMTDDYEI